MTENQQINLPNSMRYGKSKSTAVSASCSSRQFGASNGSTFNANTNEIRIPVSSHDGFLDTSRHSLELTIKNLSTDAGDTLTLCSDIACVIDQLRIESNGTILETIDRYNMYHNHKMLWSTDYSEWRQRGGTAGGPSDDTNSGATIAINSEITGTVQLQSGLLLAHHKKAIPMGCSFEIVLRLGVANTVLQNAADTQVQYEVINPRFFCPIYKIDNPSVMSDYMQVINTTPISISGDTAKSYISAIPAGTTAASISQLNDRSLSLKGVVSMLRANNTLVRNQNSLEARNLNVSSYVFNFDGQRYPTTDVLLSGTNIGRAYDQLSKVYTDDHAGVVLRANFLPGVAAGSRQGSMGVDLKKFDDEQLRMVGMNTARNSSPSTIEVVFSADPGASELMTFAVCEAVFTRLPNGSLQVAS